MTGMHNVRQISAGDRAGRSPAGDPARDPFQSAFEVPVAGGALTVERSGPPPRPGTPVVLALHGMTGTYMVYRTLARELAARTPAVCLLAPDLRGRGRSAQLPPPYGMAAHVEDLLTVLDHAGVERVVVVGHSMGASIAARFAADHPERVSGVVLLDSGVPLVSEAVVWGDGTEQTEPHGIFDRFDESFSSGDEYLAYWREHPALKEVWDDDVEEFVRHDFVEDESGAHTVANFDAVLADVNDLLIDGRTWRAAERVRSPVRLMRAERGMYDDHPLIPRDELERFVRDNPHVSADFVPGVNHFTLVLGDGAAGRVADTILDVAQGKAPALTR